MCLLRCRCPWVASGKPPSASLALGDLPNSQDIFFRIIRLIRSGRTARTAQRAPYRIRLRFLHFPPSMCAMSAALGAENDLLRLGLDPSEARQMEAAGSAVQLRRRATRPEREPPQPLDHRHHAQSIIGQQQLDELETEVLETGLYENVDYSRGSRYSVLAAEVAFSKLAS